MAGLPTLQVLLDDGTGTFPYDITSKCRLAYDVKRGRQDELSTPTAGELKLIVDNTDGRFTPGSTIIGSPSPIKADQRIRLKVTANAVTVNRFTGYVQQWPVAWPTGAQTMSEVQIAATDAQARAERRVLLSVVEEEYLTDSPDLLFVLNEPAGATAAADTSGSQGPPATMVGSGADVVFGTATGPGTDGYTAAQFAGGKYLQQLTDPGLTVDPAVGWWVEAYFLTSAVAGGPVIMSGIYNNLGVVGDLGGLALNLTSNVLVGNSVSCPSMFAAVTTNDGLLHHALAYYNNAGCKLFFDGVQVATGAAVAGAVPVLGLTIGANAVGFANTLFNGAIAYAAIGVGTITAARAAAHAGAGLTGFAGESGTARLTRLAGYAGAPIGSLDTSLTNVPFVDLTDKTAASAMQDVSDAEMGDIYVNGTGAYDFHNRQRVTAKTAPDITIDANQLAPDTSFITDMQGVLNYIETTAQGTQIRQVARATSSEANHGRYSASLSPLVSTDAEALDRANWILFTRAEPVTRVGALAIDMLTLTAAQQAALLAAEADTWIRIQNLPSQTPGGTTADLIVQGFQDVMSATSGEGTWTLTANVVSKSAIYPSVWILGDSTYGVLGSTTRLGV